MSKRSSQQPKPRDRKSNFPPKQQRQSPQQRLLPPLFEHARDAIVLIDPMACFVDANATACKLLGLPHAALIGQALLDFTDPRRGIESLQTSIKTKRQQTGKLHLSSLGNLQQVVEYTLTPDVSPGCHLLILRSLSGRVETALQQNEAQLQLIINALPVLIADVDEHQQYRFNNTAYENWLGQSPAELYGCHLQQVWGDAYPHLQPHVEAALAGQVVTYEDDLVLPDGRRRSVHVTYIPHFDEQKTVNGFFALTSDTSDRKAIERRQDEFISVVSHELRTLLTSLHSALKILASGRLGTLSPDGQQLLEVADDSVDRLVRLVNNVLDLQRIESGKGSLDRQVYNVADLMSRATAAMQPMAQQFEVVLIAKPVNLSIWADADSILQVLTNLLSNAIKFSSSGGKVWLTVEVWDRQVLFRVRDEGQGIPADKLETIFERFQQVDSSDSRKKGGIGLGLAICRKIIAQHGGKIWAESVLAQGSTFSFTVPTDLNG